MSIYQKWNRAAYVERIGGQEAADQRRRALTARQSGYRLNAVAIIDETVERSSTDGPSALGEPDS